MESRNPLGLIREWDFFFLWFYFFFKEGGSLSLLSGSVGQGLTFIEAYLLFRTLSVLPVRLLDLPQLYLRFGVFDPYLDHSVISRALLGHQIMCHSSFNSSSRSEEKVSHSVTPDPNVLRSPRILSNHGSEKNIPIYISSGSDQRDRRVAQTPESSDSGPSVLTSGIALLGFSCRGIYSGLQTRDLAKIRAKYAIPNSFSLSVLANYFRAYLNELEFSIFYEDAFLAGTHIPLHP